MDTIIILAAVFLAGWLVATWWFQPDQITFKDVIQNAFRDLREIVDPAILLAKRLWWFWGPRLTNRALLATIFADFGIVASGQPVWDFIADHPLMALGVIAMNLLTPLSAAGAPSRLPPTPSFPAGGIVNTGALQ